MNSPLVSIIITSYNRARTIAQSIESALAQSYINIEIIISDNCSTDDSDKIISNYINDPRVKYFRNGHNIGMVPNFEKAIVDLARGEYFVIVNSDDYLINNDFISEAINLINKHENVFIVKGKFKLLSEETGEVDTSKYIITKEFYKGKDWLQLANVLPFNEIYETLGWSGILINRKEFNQLQIFDTGALNLDICSGVLLLIKGNICFVDEYSYMFRTLTQRVYYDAGQTKIIYINIFKAADFISSHPFNTIYKPNLNQFYRKFYKHIIEYYLYLVYRYDKKEFKQLKAYLKLNHLEIFKEITSTLHWKLYAIAHYNITIGRLISNLKNRKLLSISK